MQKLNLGDQQIAFIPIPCQGDSKLKVRLDKTQQSTAQGSVTFTFLRELSNLFVLCCLAF